MANRVATIILLVLIGLCLWMLIALILLSSVQPRPLPSLREAGNLALAGILRGAA